MSKFAAWEPWEVAKVKRLVANGYTVIQIADQVNRSYDGVRKLCRKLGLPVASRRPEPYTKREVARLVKLARRGLTPSEIAVALRRSPLSVQEKLGKLRAAARVPVTANARHHYSGKTQRPCLRCKRPFASEGPHNRLCSECRQIDVSPYAVPAPVHLSRGRRLR